MIPISKPTITEQDKQAVLAVLDSGMLVQGPRVAELEQHWAAVCGTQHAIATSNGTTALHVAMLAHGIGPGDEVITTPFTFIASVNSIIYAGATPVFVDICPDDFNINPDLIEQAITPCTKALSFESGLLNFSLGSNDLQSGWGHVSSSSDNTVESIKLDDLFLDERIIDIFKIDVEGFEYEVLKGSEKLLQNKRIKNIFFEINEGLLRTKNISGQFVIDYLKNFGYQVDFITDEIAWAKI